MDALGSDVTSEMSAAASAFVSKITGKYVDSAICSEAQVSAMQEVVAAAEVAAAAAEHAEMLVVPDSAACPPALELDAPEEGQNNSRQAFVQDEAGDARHLVGSPTDFLSPFKDRSEASSALAGYFSGTPSTEEGTSPDPSRAWRHEVFTSQSCAVSAPTPSVAELLSPTGVDRASSSADAARPRPFLPSPPGTAPAGAGRRPLPRVQRRASHPAAMVGRIDPAVLPEPWHQSLEEREREALCVKLAAQQFVSQTVLSTVLRKAALATVEPPQSSPEQLPQASVVESDRDGNVVVESDRDGKVAMSTEQNGRASVGLDQAQASSDMTLLEFSGSSNGGESKNMEPSRPVTQEYKRSSAGDGQREDVVSQTLSLPGMASEGKAGRSEPKRNSRLRSPRHSATAALDTLLPPSDQSQASTPSSTTTAVASSGRLRPQRSSFSTRLPVNETLSAKTRRSSMNEMPKATQDEELKRRGSDCSVARIRPQRSTFTQGLAVKAKGKTLPDTCATCGNVFKSDSAFCRLCGAKRSTTSPSASDMCSCGQQYKAHETVCRKCGLKRPQAENACHEICSCGNVFKADSRFCRKCGLSRPGVDRGASRRSVAAARKPRPPGVSGFSSPQPVVDENEEMGSDWNSDADDACSMRSCRSLGHDEDDNLGESSASFTEEREQGAEPLWVDTYNMGVADWQQEVDKQISGDEELVGNVASSPQSTSPWPVAQSPWHEASDGVLGSVAAVGWADPNSVHDSYRADHMATLEATVSGEQLGQLLAKPCFDSMFGYAPVTLSLDETAAATMYAAVGGVPMMPGSWQPDQQHLWQQQLWQQQLWSHQQQYMPGYMPGYMPIPTSGSPETDYPDYLSVFGNEDEDVEMARQESSNSQSPVQDETLKPPLPVFDNLKKGSREASNTEKDLIIVSTRRGVGGTGAQASAKDEPAGASTPRHGRSSTLGHMMDDSSAGELAGGLTSPSPTGDAATGLQVRSVRLLQQLEKPRDAPKRSITPAAGLHRGGTSYDVGVRTRPSSVAGVLRTSKGGRRRGAHHLSNVGSAPKSPPAWNTSFVNVHERRIPRYDALIDDQCPIMTSPARLKHLIKTRELSSEYFHIVRQRFESHRRNFDPDRKLGDRLRPSPPGVRDQRGKIPTSMLQRVEELHGQQGMDAPWEDFELTGANADESEAAGGASLASASKPQVAPTLACSTEWHDTPLHYSCIRERDGNGDMLPFLGDGVAEAVAEPEGGPAAERLPARWERLRARVEMLWRELSIPIDIRETVQRGPFASVTADSVYRLEMHQQELLEYRAATRSIILDCMEREVLSQAVQQAHVLGVNDKRLAALRDNLTALNQIGTSLVRTIGTWSRRFGHLAVDVSKVPSIAAGGVRPRAVFQWIGRDVVEWIQTEAEAIASGYPWGNSTSSEATRKSQVGGKGEQSLKLASSPLVSLAMAGQRFEVGDVLHNGPPPSWYHPRVARAGIQAIRRGIPCGGGEKRL